MNEFTVSGHYIALKPDLKKTKGCYCRRSTKPLQFLVSIKSIIVAMVFFPVTKLCLISDEKVLSKDCVD